jgi:N-acetylglucosaminyldiphosphoundecaprenol N-acetyl-beta-D-mannosaminyltransferase
MHDERKWKHIDLFGCTMDAATMDDSVSWITERIKARRFTQHVVVNVAKIVNMQSDENLANSVRACDIVNIDGMGVVWGARFLGFPVPERVTGVDLFERLLQMAEAYEFPVFFLGATPEVVEEVARRCCLRHQNLKVAGFHHGYFGNDEAQVVGKIRNSGARLLFVAISSPRKEVFINRWKDELGVDFVMGVGGTFDVVAGKVSRAPVWMQKTGLEWLYRVLQEPGRMWRRYLITNSRFAIMLAHAYVRRYWT